jgi:uncharacterized membrane protein
MVKLNDFIMYLENSLSNEQTAPSTEQIRQEMAEVAIPVVKGNETLYQFLDGETLSVDSVVRYAEMLVA